MENREGALEIIRGAVHNEISGQQLYDDAVRYAIDLGAKQILDTLAREEERHVNLLLGEYDALCSLGRWLDPQEAMQHGAKVDVGRVLPSSGAFVPELFPPGWSPTTALERTMDDLSALAFGLQIEEIAVALYEQEAGAATDTIAAETYRFLAEEERRHVRLLSDHWQRLAGVPWMEG